MSSTKLWTANVPFVSNHFVAVDSLHKSIYHALMKHNWFACVRGANQNPRLTRPDQKPPCCLEIRHKVPRVHLYARDPIKQPLLSLQLGFSLNRTKTWKHEWMTHSKTRDSFWQTVAYNFWHTETSMIPHKEWMLKISGRSCGDGVNISWENGVSLYTGQFHWFHD